MSTAAASPSNWFEHGGSDYARFRPQYPPALAAFLASLAPARRLAVDVGCGSGQLTHLLAAHFDAVLGVDSSADQLANAAADARISWLCAPAEQLPLADRSADLIAAAQAAHWFDLPAFYREVRRIAAPGAVVALVSYGVLTLDAALDARFQRFYRDGIGPFWPAERALVDSGYATLAFPFEEFVAPGLEIRLEWTLAEFLGYVGTWSAVRRARDAGQGGLLEGFADELAAAWGDAGQRRAIVWPIRMRVGKVG